jgi:magnesium transporter
MVGMLVLCGVFILTHHVDLAGSWPLALGWTCWSATWPGHDPVVLRELGRDPAHASSIFLTTITDSTVFSFSWGWPLLLL